MKSLCATPSAMALVAVLGAMAFSLFGADPGRARAPDSRSGSPRVHDPSTIVQHGGWYWCFSTAPGVQSLRSRDLVAWQPGPSVFSTPPSWTSNAVPGNRGHFWAPDIIPVSNRFLLYYSVSTWGKTTSAIGLAVNNALDPNDPNFGWRDFGPVVSTGSGDNYNAIDPSVMRDSDGRLWMAYGSYWSGIKLIELNPDTGLRITTNSPQYSLAWNDSIEAAGLHRRGTNYYLFVNWGQCCRGTNSTYEIRVGKSSRVTGPYLDKTGKDLMAGGGTLFLATAGDRIGPGHAAFFTANGKDYISYHYYNRQTGGRPALAVRHLAWTPDGWPSPGSLLQTPEEEPPGRIRRPPAARETIEDEAL